MKFEDVILSVLEDFKDINLHSEAGRKVLLGEIMAQIKNQHQIFVLHSLVQVINKDLLLV